MYRHRRPAVILAIMVAMLGTLAAPALPAQADGTAGFVTRSGTQLKLDGRQFRFAGSNNYYLMYKSRVMVDDVFADAAAADFTVLRTWGWLDIGAADGADSVAGKQEGVYFQYWGGGAPAYNDGPDGLARLDYVLYAARAAGVKLIIPFTNNWSDFGGMDQYVRWRGGAYHDDFYTDPVIRGWYRDWIAHLLNRTNTLTGVKYKDDPTVMAWELANEPRCQGSGVYPTSAACKPAVTTAWADEMTRYIKSIDHRHLTGVGDEGFTCDNPGTDDWTTNCGPGMDYAALTALPAVDLASLHLYPDGWGKTPQWGTQWLTSHIQRARDLGKAVVVGEFGLKDKTVRNVVYRDWTEAIRKAGGNGFLYWILSGVQDDGTLYPDYDGFTVYCPSPVCLNLTNAGDELAHGQSSRPPVADHDTTVTEFDTPATLTPLANDIAYRTYLLPATLTITGATGGAFAKAADGTVTFTPAAGFVGKAVAHYTVRDAAGRWSNTADLTVTVKPDPTAAIVIDSFENGIGSWAPGNWQTNAGVLSPTTAYHSDGSAAMHIAAADGGWFGTTYATPLNLTGKAYLKYEVHAAPAAGTSTTVALQVGPGWSWCQGSWTWVPQDSTSTIQIDLFNSVSCDQASLAEVHGLLIYISPGEFDVDHIRAE